MSEEIYLAVGFGGLLGFGFTAVGFGLDVRSWGCRRTGDRFFWLGLRGVAFGSGFRDEPLLVLPELFF